MPAKYNKQMGNQTARDFLVLFSFYFPMKVFPEDHYLVVVRAPVYLTDPESYAGGSLAPGRVTHARQVEG